jgi:hypothetical protein
MPKEVEKPLSHLILNRLSSASSLQSQRPRNLPGLLPLSDFLNFLALCLPNAFASDNL